MKAYWAYARLADPDLSFEDAVHRARAALRRKRGEGAEREPLDRLVAEPDYGATLAYDKMMARLAELEKRVCV